MGSLLTAVKNGEVQKVKRLLKEGAGKDKNAGQGTYVAPLIPLHAAAKGNQLKIAEMLLDYNNSVNCADLEGVTALFLAVWWGHREMAELLIERGATVNMVNSNGSTPLHWACGGGSAECVHVLLINGARLMVKNNVGKSPRWFAVHYKRREVIEYLDDLMANMETGRMEVGLMRPTTP